MRPGSLIILILATPGLAQVVPYEGNAYPETQGWSRYAYCTPERSIHDGWLVQDVDPSECTPPPEGDQDNYTRTIAEFDGVYEFYVEWRIQVEGASSEFPWGAPFVISASNLGGEAYWFAIANDQIQFIRDDFAVILYIDVDPDTPHTYHLEIFRDDLYVIYVDGVAVHQGVPGGPFPSFFPSITWRARSAYLSSVVFLDYLRYGVIAQDASGDADTNGQVNSDDFYVFQECLSTPAGSWPGCSWADMDSDGDTDCDDWTLFLTIWSDPADPPTVPQCLATCPADLDGDDAVNASDLAQLLGAWGPNPGHPANLNGDDAINAADLALLLGAWGRCP